MAGEGKDFEESFVGEGLYRHGGGGRGREAVEVPRRSRGELSCWRRLESTGFPRPLARLSKRAYLERIKQ